MPPEADAGTGDPNGAPNNTPAWTTTLDTETQGYLQNRGWHEKTPAEVAVLASKAHREAEKFIGAPADQIVRLPKATDSADAWKPVYERLGAPADPAGYDFSGVKNAKGEPIPQNLQDFLRSQATALHLPKDAAPALGNALVAFNETAAAAHAADVQAANIKALEGLKQSWGPNFEANTFVANQAAAKLGLGADILDTLKGVVGGEKVAQALLSIGLKIGEDRFVSNDNPGNPGTYTREQAVSQLADLKRDTAWVGRLLAGDVDANKQMEALNRIIVAE